MAKCVIVAAGESCCGEISFTDTGFLLCYRCGDSPVEITVSGNAMKIYRDLSYGISCKLLLSAGKSLPGKLYAGENQTPIKTHTSLLDIAYEDDGEIRINAAYAIDFDGAKEEIELNLIIKTDI